MMTLRKMSKDSAARRKASRKPKVIHLSRREKIRELLKCAAFGVAFVLLLSTPKMVGQINQERFLEALKVDTPVHLEMQHASSGILDVHVTSGGCRVPNGTEAGTYWLRVYIVQGGTVLARHMRNVRLQTVETSAVPAGLQRRLGGDGGDDTTQTAVSEKLEFDLSGHDAGGPPAEMVLETNCPAMLSTLVTLSDLGVVGKVQVWVALVLLICILTMILTEVIHRTLAAFVGAASVLFVMALERRLPTMTTVITWMDHGTLALLWGMMVIVALLSRTGVFEWCAVRVFQASGANMWKLYCMLMVFDCVLSAFLDNVTTMLLLGPVVLSLCRAIDVEPKPMLISLAIFGTVGGTSTMIGDPPNIIIGNALSNEIGFLDFLIILGPGVLLITPFSLLFARWHYGSEYFKKDVSTDVGTLKAQYPICDPRLLIQAGSVLCACIFMFFLHPVTHLDPAYVACFGAALLLLLADHKNFEYALERVEWDTLLFFAGLFVFTEGIAELGLLREIADALSSVISSVPAGERQLAANIIVQVVSAVVSAFVDNIPFTTTMIPVIRRMTANVECLALKPLAWSLAFGADLGGMGTLIGTSANVVMAGFAQEAGHRVSFMDFFKIGQLRM